VAENFLSFATASEPDSAHWYGTKPLAEVAGTTRPTSFDPADWDVTELAVEGSLEGGQTGHLLGSVTWQGYDDADTSQDPAPADTGATTGTIAPSGMTEGVGSFDLGR
jgi:hypothetical protein